MKQTRTVHGMRNLGNTCYLNATIQCLLAIKRIRYILDVITPQSNAIDFFIECFDKKQSCTQTPSSVYELYVSLFCNIQRNTPQDSVECLLRFLDYFEKQTEIRKPYKYMSLLENDQCSCVSFWERIPTNSIVRDIFTGIIHTRTQCHSCNNQIEKFDTYQMLPIHAETSKSVKHGFMQFINIPDQICNAKCDSCSNSSVIFTKTQSIHKIPSVLLFEIIGSTRELNIEETIVIDHAHGFERTRLVYKLKALILYSNAHYTSIVYDSDQQCFYHVDDTRIEECTIDVINKEIMIRCAIYEQTL